MKNYEYPGAIHIHSTYSDGTAKIESIVHDAKKSGLKWIIITDHNSLTGLKKGFEGFHGDMCVLIAQEISPTHGNHYLAFDIYDEISPNLPPEEFIKIVNNKGGFGFIAHPDETIERDNIYPALRWDNWNINGFQGIEIWNYMSDWVDTLSSKNKIHKFLFPDKSLQGPTPDVIKWWDSLNNNDNKIVPAIAGLDVHSFEYSYFGLPLKVFPYLQSFKTLQNYIQIDDVLSRDFETAKKQIYNALKTGNNLMVNRTLKSPAGMVFTATKKNSDNKFIKATVGEFLTVENDFIIDIETPVPCDIKLFLDGNITKQEVTDHLKFKTTQIGSYRFEAYLNNYHWIISNPIKVIKSQTVET